MSSFSQLNESDNEDNVKMMKSKGSKTDRLENGSRKGVGEDSKKGKSSDQRELDGLLSQDLLSLLTKSTYGYLRVINEDGTLNAAFPQDEKFITVGRSVKCMLRQGINSISRQHANFRVDEKSHMWLECVTNHQTLVDGEVVEDGENVQLYHNSQIVFGSGRFIFEYPRKLRSVMNRQKGMKLIRKMRNNTNKEEVVSKDKNIGDHQEKEETKSNSGEAIVPSSNTGTLKPPVRVHRQEEIVIEEDYDTNIDNNIDNSDKENLDAILNGLNPMNMDISEDVVQAPPPFVDYNKSIIAFSQEIRKEVENQQMKELMASFGTPLSQKRESKVLQKLDAEESSPRMVGIEVNGKWFPPIITSSRKRASAKKRVVKVLNMDEGDDTKIDTNLSSNDNNDNSTNNDHTTNNTNSTSTNNTVHDTPNDNSNTDTPNDNSNTDTPNDNSNTDTPNDNSNTDTNNTSTSNHTENIDIVPDSPISHIRVNALVSTPPSQHSIATSKRTLQPSHASSTRSKRSTAALSQAEQSDIIMNLSERFDEEHNSEMVDTDHSSSLLSVEDQLSIIDDEDVATFSPIPNESVGVEEQISVEDEEDGISISCASSTMHTSLSRSSKDSKKSKKTSTSGNTMNISQKSGNSMSSSSSTSGSSSIGSNRKTSTSHPNMSNITNNDNNNNDNNIQTIIPSSLAASTHEEDIAINNTIDDDLQNGSHHSTPFSKHSSQNSSLCNSEPKSLHIFKRSAPSRRSMTPGLKELQVQLDAYSGLVDKTTEMQPAIQALHAVLEQEEGITLEEESEKNEKETENSGLLLHADTLVSAFTRVLQDPIDETDAQQVQARDAILTTQDYIPIEQVNILFETNHDSSSNSDTNNEHNTSNNINKDLQSSFIPNPNETLHSVDDAFTLSFETQKSVLMENPSLLDLVKSIVYENTQDVLDTSANLSAHANNAITTANNTSIIKSTPGSSRKSISGRYHYAKALDSDNESDMDITSLQNDKSTLDISSLRDKNASMEDITEILPHMIVESIAQANISRFQTQHTNLGVPVRTNDVPKVPFYSTPHRILHTASRIQSERKIVANTTGNGHNSNNVTDNITTITAVKRKAPRKIELGTPNRIPIPSTPVAAAPASASKMLPRVALLPPKHVTPKVNKTAITYTRKAASTTKKDTNFLKCQLLNGLIKSNDAAGVPKQLLFDDVPMEQPLQRRQSVSLPGSIKKKRPLEENLEQVTKRKKRVISQIDEE